MEIKDRVKPITIKNKDTGRVYVLEFSRDTISMAEQAGFNWDDFPKMVATYTPILWLCAFRMHDKRISLAETNKILDQVGGLTSETIRRLRELWDQGLAPLVNDESEETEKNAKWEVDLG